MNYIKLTLMAALLAMLNGCGLLDEGSKSLPVSYALEGTKTAIVGIALDKTGTPKETVKEIILFPGQRVVFAGPDEFSIIFKNKKTPNKRIENRSVNGVVIINVSDEILDQPEFAEEFRKNNFLKFDYAIRANGKELDPPMIIKRN